MDNVSFGQAQVLFSSFGFETTMLSFSRVGANMSRSMALVVQAGDLGELKTASNKLEKVGMNFFFFFMRPVTKKISRNFAVHPTQLTARTDNWRAHPLVVDPAEGGSLAIYCVKQQGG